MDRAPALSSPICRCSPLVTVTSPAVGTSDEFVRLTEANNPSLGSIGPPCLPDTNHSAGGAQKAPLAALSTQSVQLDRKYGAAATAGVSEVGGSDAPNPKKMFVHSRTRHPHPYCTATSETHTSVSHVESVRNVSVTVSYVPWFF
jgi:hypothetical protein